MFERIAQTANWLLGPEHATQERPGHLWARWMFLRALAIFYFSAFYSLIFQIRGLVGPNGILPAGDYLQAVAGALHGLRFWYAPTLFWFGSSDHALMLVSWIGLVAALLVAPAPLRIPAIAAVSLVTLASLGSFGGHLGGAPMGRAALRVVIGGAWAMAITAAIGRIFGVAMG